MRVKSFVDGLRLLEEEQQRREATLEALRTEVKKGLASGQRETRRGSARST